MRLEGVNLPWSSLKDGIEVHVIATFPVKMGSDWSELYKAEHELIRRFPRGSGNLHYSPKCSEQVSVKIHCEVTELCLSNPSLTVQRTKYSRTTAPKNRA